MGLLGKRKLNANTKISDEAPIIWACDEDVMI
jgi:hypothetical protein